MTAHSRFIVGVVLAGAALTGAVLAESVATPQQTPPPAGQTQQPPAGRGQDPGQRGAGGAGANQGQGGQGRGGGGGGRRGGFTQYTRELAPADVLVRGKGLYEANCASCHATDLRGGPNGSNLLRSGTALADQHGDLVGEAVSQHKPAITLVTADTTAIAEYLHSIHATMGGQGSPPGRNPTGIELNVLVGDAMAGATYFQAACSKCHSVTGDLAGIGSKYTAARDLQNAWVSGSSGRFGGGGGGGGGRGGGGGGNPATVTMADGSKIEGTLIRKTDWLVILTLADGTRKSIPRDPNSAFPKLDVKDPNEAHKKMVLELDDANNKKMHDVTAYLWTIK